MATEGATSAEAQQRQVAADSSDVSFPWHCRASGGDALRGAGAGGAAAGWVIAKIAPLAILFICCFCGTAEEAMATHRATPQQAEQRQEAAHRASTSSTGFAGVIEMLRDSWQVRAYSSP